MLDFVGGGEAQTESSSGDENGDQQGDQSESQAAAASASVDPQVDFADVVRSLSQSESELSVCVVERHLNA